MNVAVNIPTEKHQFLYLFFEKCLYLCLALTQDNQNWKNYYNKNDNIYVHCFLSTFLLKTLESKMGKADDLTQHSAKDTQKIQD